MAKSTSSKSGKTAGQTSSAAKGKRVKDPFDHLKKQHQMVADLLDKMSVRGERALAKRDGLFEELKTAFMQHSQMEEEILYPALKRLEETHDLALEAYEEHKEAKKMIKDMEAMATDSEEWEDSLALLTEDIEHHVEEEENEMFPEAKKILAKADVQDIAEQFEEFEKSKTEE